MKTLKWSYLIVAAALAAGAFTVPAADVNESGTKAGHLHQRAKEKLGLTEEQTKQIKAALKSDKENLAALLRRLHEARTELRAAMHASGANESTVRAASAKVSTAEADLAVERLKIYGKLSPILTGEQREKLETLQAHVDTLLDRAISRREERMSN